MAHRFNFYCACFSETRSLPDRYRNVAEVAKSRSILSLGMSCFKLQDVGQALVSKESCNISADDVQVAAEDEPSAGLSSLCEQVC